MTQNEFPDWTPVVPVPLMGPVLLDLEMDCMIRGWKLERQQAKIREAAYNSGWYDAKQNYGRNPSP
jgi:hypothetical protein